MRFVLYALLILTALGGVFVGAFIGKHSQSAIHEIEALICFLIAVVSFAGLAVASAIEHWSTVQADRAQRSEQARTTYRPAS